ncbi:MAG TPA: YHS domain-containing (seleno)protein [Pseudolabrys sp.]|nr:YHS domain-containing (seleno)protein [Pseudolabrys sp.]
MCLLVVLAAGGPPNPAAGATNDRIVTEPLSGLAISGYDPVAYFTEARAVAGLPSLECGYAGTVWRFHNAGNRAAFVRDPDVYMPHYGGYDPVAVARGASVPGHPQVWLVVDQRLYFFYDTKARADFAADPARYVRVAEERWPQVREQLAR